MLCYVMYYTTEKQPLEDLTLLERGSEKKKNKKNMNLQARKQPFHGNMCDTMREKCDLVQKYLLYRRGHALLNVGNNFGKQVLEHETSCFEIAYITLFRTH